MSIDSVYPDQYQTQLLAKTEKLRNQFAEFFPPQLEVFESPVSHYRMRAEFKIWHQDGQAHYAMFQPGVYKQPFIIETFPVGSQLINDLMPALLQAINASDLLRNRLFQVEFLTTLSQEAVVTLIYHKPLDDAWHAQAEQLSTDLGIDIIGRSRKQKRVIGKDFVTEQLTVNNRSFSYQQVETGFTQPNARVCEKMLSWAMDTCQGASGDLLELYCGNGNFTLPLSTCFERVLATEISKTSVNSALYNCQLNGIDNIAIARMSSEEFVEAWDGVRSFRRLEGITLEDYRFSTIFVDPPRAGLDDATINLVKRFDKILYISCNPDTLYQNLCQLAESHIIKRFALFDQFPYTHHMETGVYLVRR